MELDDILDVLERVAPTKLAESWDNVGLLVRGSTPKPVQRALLTIDSSDAVFAEAVSLDCQLVISYHPPIFGGLERLAPNNRAARLAITAIENGIAVYSPHTALDAAAGGVNDWLADAFGAAQRRAIVPRGDVLGSNDPVIGQGRHLTLHQPLTLDAALAAIKSHLGLGTLRVAPARQTGPERIRTVALCAGAGGSVLATATADLLLTGEMRHHEVLHRCESGTHVVLTEHSNSERGYLQSYARTIAALAPGVQFYVSKVDADPLHVV